MGPPKSKRGACCPVIVVRRLPLPCIVASLRPLPGPGGPVAARWPQSESATAVTVTMQFESHFLCYSKFHFNRSFGNVKVFNFKN